MLRAELEKNLRRFVGRFAYVRLWAIHEASDRLLVHVPQASSDPTLQLILRSGLPATPVNFCLRESPKVLNWASLGDNGRFDAVAACTGFQAYFPQPGALPLLLSCSCSRGLLAFVVLHKSFLQYMVHVRLADVELLGQRVPWCTTTVAHLFHQPVLACFGVVSVVSSHFQFPFKCRSTLKLFEFQNRKHRFPRNSQTHKSFTTKGLPKLVVDLPKLSNGFPSFNFIHALHPACTMCFFRKKKLLLEAMVMEVKVVWVDFWQSPRKLLFSISNFVQSFIGHPLQENPICDGTFYIRL